MAFFNYSTMQMTAKIVYYGPGLGGKTTNLQFVYGHTAEGSRGEMVSLETQTDRTLFFDLLPMEVGTVAGFKTRIQLYTVPGQVFYNTTRKLVLKGVDGIVFVADSQNPMLQANVESLRNLEDNLAELGLSLDNVPMALQYNKRDLPETLSLEELESSLNQRKWLAFEASAITGEGVFETLRGITRLTLISLKGQLEGSTTPWSGPKKQVPAAVQPPTTPPPPAGQQEESPESATSPAETQEPPPTRQRIRRDYLLRLPTEEFGRTQSVLVGLKLEDSNGEVIRESREVRLQVDGTPDLDEILVQLNLAVRLDR
jgi:signal recognition particle receptor subunit beta